MKKFTKIASTALVGLLALGLAGCGNANSHKAKTPSSGSHSSKVVKTNKSKKNSNTKVNKKKSNKMVQNNKADKANNGNSSSQNSKSNAKLSNNEQKSLKSEESRVNPTVDLGHGVIGHEGRGAGQVYITFTCKGHTYTVHGNDVQSDDNAVDKARQVVDQLQSEPSSSIKTSKINNNMIQANGTK